MERWRLEVREGGRGKERRKKGRRDWEKKMEGEITEVVDGVFEGGSG